MPKTTIGKSLFLDGELTGKDGLTIKGKLNGKIKVEGSILVEKDANGPVKKICFVSTQIASVILQDEVHA